jgi:hypothetical protein
MAMNSDPATMQAKIFLRENGWRWSRKLRRWELTTPTGLLTASSAAQAIVIHPWLAEGADEKAQ